MGKIVVCDCGDSFSFFGFSVFLFVVGGIICDFYLLSRLSSSALIFRGIDKLLQRQTKTRSVCEAFSTKCMSMQGEVPCLVGHTLGTLCTVGRFFFCGGVSLLLRKQWFKAVTHPFPAISMPLMTCDLLSYPFLKGQDVDVSGASGICAWSSLMIKLKFGDAP